MLPGTFSGGPAKANPTVTVDASVKLPRQGYRLRIKPGGIEIQAPDAAGAFYAKMTLGQIERQRGDALPACEIEDHPDFPTRGVLLYISGGKVPKMETLFMMVDEFAEWKINHLELGIEHTFAYRNHRDVWANASPMTHEEIRQLDAYCRERFIELVPHQQSFGHFARWLELPRYRPLAENPEAARPDSLCPIDPGSIALLDELYAELLPCFSSRKFNVCCDEVGIGTHRSKNECDRKGKGRVYLDFLLKVHQLVKKQGHTMHFWGDILFHHPELIPELPRDIVLLDWGYEANSPFNERGARLAASGIPFYVCPGTSTWNNLIGRTHNCLINLRDAAANGIKHGAIGYLNTDWGDNGHWQHLPISHFGFAAGAALSWCYEANRREDFIAALDLHVFRDKAGVMGRFAYDLGNAYLGEGSWLEDDNYLPDNGSVFFLWLFCPEDNQIMRRQRLPGLRGTREYIRTVLETLDRSRMQRPDAELIKAEFMNNASMALWACERGIGVLSGTIAEDKVRQALASGMKTILADHRRLWLARNREGGLGESQRVLEQRLSELQ